MGGPPADCADPVAGVRPEPEAIGAHRCAARRPPGVAKTALRRVPRAGVPERPDPADEERCHAFATRTRHSGPVATPTDERRRCDGRPDDPTAPRRALAVPASPSCCRPTCAGGHRDRRCARRLVPGALAGGRPRRLRHRPLRDAAAGGGRPRRRAAGRRCPAPPRRSSPSPGHRTAAGSPTWSAPAARSAPSCTWCAPTAAATAWSPGRTRAPPCSPAAGPARATTSARSPPATGRTPTSSWSTSPPVRTAPSPAAASSRSRSVSADERFVLARRGPRGYRHIVVIDVATGVQRRVLGLDAPGGIASEDGRFGPDGRSVYVRASLPGAPFADRAGLVAVPLSEDGVPGEGRVVLSRAGRRPGRLRAADRRHRARRVERRRGHRTAACTTVADGAVVRADRAARAGHAGLVAVGRRRRRWSPS